MLWATKPRILFHNEPNVPIHFFICTMLVFFEISDTWMPDTVWPPLCLSHHWYRSDTLFKRLIDPIETPYCCHAGCIPSGFVIVYVMLISLFVSECLIDWAFPHQNFKLHTGILMIFKISLNVWISFLR